MPNLKRLRLEIISVLPAMVLLLGCCGAQAQTELPGPDVETLLAARRDVWGLAAMAQPDGPSYDFFERLLPPLRYVNAAFRHYPIVLSAPAATVKARLVSNGSALNARAAQSSWKEFQVPVTFLVGDEEAIFGTHLEQLEGPHYEGGYLPIVQLRYRSAGAVYAEEVFAGVGRGSAEQGIVWVRFSLVRGDSGRIAAQLGTLVPWQAGNRVIADTNGQVVAWFDQSWKWDAGHGQLWARIDPKHPAIVSFATRPAKPVGGQPGIAGATRNSLRVSASRYAEARRRCLKTWQSLLDRGTLVDVPESRVNNAWRALVVSLFTLTEKDYLNYSAGNSYQRQYEAECGDAVRALALFGQPGEACRTLAPLLDYVQPGVRFHDAAFKLQMLAHYFWLTRDTNFIQALRPRWEREADLILGGRERETGLLPKENYCGDIQAQVYSLNSSANSWRALRDFGAVLDAVGDAATAQRLGDAATSFRRAILSAVDRSERRDVRPAFIPVALFGEEQPYDALTATQLGGYWCLMAPYLLGSGVFGPGAERQRAIVDYLQEHGGVALGLIRFDMHMGLYANADALDDLYGLRYTLALLELDEPDRALASFYGKLAQGLTRDTFIGAEGTGLRAVDVRGRPMFLPPNSSSQAYFLWMLRYLLVQDWDLDDDGRPETLRLCFATPRRWLRDGNVVRVEHAPTAFGEVSLKLTSKLRRGVVLAELELPQRNPARRALLRIRLPDGWRAESATLGKVRLPLDGRGTVELPSAAGRVSVRFEVKPAG